MSTVGRPRSEQARRAVLEAVDDLLVEQGYAAMTMKGIAERAGVGRQTVYRWWANKAEILLEACAADAAHELVSVPADDPHVELITYLDALTAFLTTSDAGLAYRALLGEAQQDATVRALVATTDILDSSARTVLGRLRDRGELPDDPGLDLDLAAAQLIGPTLYRILVPGPRTPEIDTAGHARQLLRSWTADPAPRAARRATG